jgi:predicted PurR-regulated permease PerM
MKKETQDKINGFLKRESLVYLITAVLAVVIIFTGIFVYIGYFSDQMDEPIREEKTLIEKQTEALEALNRDAQPLTEAEIKEQSEALEKIDIKPLTEEEIQRQTEELDNLR